jgi:hypothetical protein
MEVKLICGLPFSFVNVISLELVYQTYQKKSPFYLWGHAVGNGHIFMINILYPLLRHPFQRIEPYLNSFSGLVD